MTTERDALRIVRSWLEEGRTALPDHVLDAVLDQLPATPQHRPSWPARRIADMNTVTKYAIAAAAVVVVAILGINLLASGGSGNIGAAPPSPSSTAPTTAAPLSPAPTVAWLHEGELEPGTYRQNVGGSLTLTVPDGWTGGTDQFLAHKTDPSDQTSFVELAVWPITHVYANSCDWEGTLVEVRTPSELTTALAAQTGHETSRPAETTLGGYRATRLEFSVPADFDVSSCDGVEGIVEGIIRLWPDAGPDEDYGLPIAPGQTTTVYVLDDDSPLRVVAAERSEGSSAADVAELEAVVDSLEFEP
jgi:hypothetical protein